MSADTPSTAPAARPLTSLPPDPGRFQKQLEAMMEIAWDVSSTLHVDALLPRIMEKVTDIMKADRSTFYSVDRSRGELWSKVIQGVEPTEIRLKVGEGIAGWAAQTGTTVNLEDAYEDSRFDRTWDKQSGYRTRSLLCVPILDRELNVIAVIQCLNKKGSRAFGDEDEELLRSIGSQCAVALESALLYEALLERNRALEQAELRLRRANAELEILYDVEQQISEASDLPGLLIETLDRACSLLGVECGAVLLTGEAGGEVFVHRPGFDPVPPMAVDARRARSLVTHAKVPIRRVRDQGGGVAETLMPERQGLEIRETFTAPLSDARSTIGLIQLVNRTSEDQGDDWMLRMLTLLAGQVARGVVMRREREAGERAERLALLGHSLGALLHDMRTPMTAIGGFSELMADEQDDATRRDYVGRIERALSHMEGMTQEVLAFAKGQREILARKVYMSKFIDAVREMLVPETESYGAKLVVEADYDGVARFDESKLKRVIFNLARNACQAMGEGGTFTWRVQREGDNLVFECQDTGPGIPKQMEGKLFRSFATHGKSDGTGIGLAMAKKIIDAHCGTISASSSRQGATFRIELPL